MVGTRARQQIGDERARLSNPLAVADHGLKGRRLRRRLSRETVTVFHVSAVGFDGAGRVRRGAAAAALVQLHPTELVVEGRGAVAGAIAQASAFGLPRVWRLRARVECECASTRAAAPGFLEGRACLVVRYVRLARVGEQRQDGGDALRRGGAASRDGDKESGRRSGYCMHTSPPRAWAYSIRWSLTARDAHVSLSFFVGPLRITVPFPPPDWMMKTSLPRTLSSISTRVSPPLNLASSTFAGGMPRWLQIVLCLGQQRVHAICSVPASRHTG